MHGVIPPSDNRLLIFVSECRRCRLCAAFGCNVEEWLLFIRKQHNAHGVLFFPVEDNTYPIDQFPALMLCCLHNMTHDSSFRIPWTPDIPFDSIEPRNVPVKRTKTPPCLCHHLQYFRKREHSIRGKEKVGKDKSSLCPPDETNLAVRACFHHCQVSVARFQDLHVVLMCQEVNLG